MPLKNISLKQRITLRASTLLIELISFPLLNLPMQIRKIPKRRLQPSNEPILIIQENAIRQHISILMKQDIISLIGKNRAMKQEPINGIIGFNKMIKYLNNSFLLQILIDLQYINIIKSILKSM